MITVLKADKLDVALLEAKYGFVTPQKVLQALQRDAIQGKADIFQEDIYERPMEEVTPNLNLSSRTLLRGEHLSGPIRDKCCHWAPPSYSWTSWWRSRGRHIGGCWNSC